MCSYMHLGLWAGRVFGSHVHPPDGHSASDKTPPSQPLAWLEALDS